MDFAPFGLFVRQKVQKAKKTDFCNSKLKLHIYFVVMLALAVYNIVRGRVIMNQKKIGQFIAKRRKQLKLTQLALAEKLGVSDRSVSNWENGICLPDASLYTPLCEMLEISVSELFAGEFECDLQENQLADNHFLHILELQLYETTSKEIDFDDFRKALTAMFKASILLKKFKDRKNAIEYLVEQTGLSESECETAYDIYTKL